MKMRSRIAVVAVLLVALVAAGVTRQLALSQRAASGAATAAGSGASKLNNLNSFALALLLGGLRGPLVMVLWSSSEAQKTERDLEDFDTKVELIRLLQPEFDTVHIFQIWNKAYNISAQLAAMTNKYAAILDALDYAESVLEQRPGNLSIIYEIAGLYGVKLGDSTDKEYYRYRVRKDTITDMPAARLRRGDAGWRKLRLDQMVDPQTGMILPKYLEADRERPADLPEGAQWLTGGELQFLEPYQPFPYGISPLALGYNYFKVAQVMVDHYDQHHAQHSDSVVTRRPAIVLSLWAAEEKDRARELEIRAFDKEVPENAETWALPTASVPLTAGVGPDDADAVEEALYSYAQSARVAGDSVGEYERFLRTTGPLYQPFESHIEDVRLLRATALADRAYLAAVRSDDPQEKAELARAAAEHYREMMGRSYASILKYYVPYEALQLLLPEGITRNNLNERLPPETSAEELGKYVQQYLRMRALRGADMSYEAPELQVYMMDVQRATSRLELIEDYLATDGATAATAAAN